MTASCHSVKVGNTSAPSTITFTFDTGGELNATTPYVVVTQGAPKLDFLDAGGSTCAAGITYKVGDTCSVKVTFTPKQVGARYGAVNLYDSHGDAIAIGYVYGTGLGPLAVFANTTSGTYTAGQQIILGSGFGGPNGVAVDASGNVFVAEGGNNAVQEIVAVNGSIPASPTIKTLGSGFDLPCGVAVDGAATSSSGTGTMLRSKRS